MIAFTFKPAFSIVLPILQYTRGASAGELDWQTKAPSSVKNVAIRAKVRLYIKYLKLLLMDQENQ